MLSGGISLPEEASIERVWVCVAPFMSLQVGADGSGCIVNHRSHLEPVGTFPPGTLRLQDVLLAVKPGLAKIQPADFEKMFEPGLVPDIVKIRSRLPNTIPGMYHYRLDSYDRQVIHTLFDTAAGAVTTSNTTFRQSYFETDSPWSNNPR